MTVARRLVLGAAILVLVTFFLLRGAAERSTAELVGTILIILLLASTVALLTGRLFARQVSELTTAIRQIAAGTAPRLGQTGIPELDTLADALRQMHRDVAGRVDLLQGEQRDATAIIGAMVEGVIAADARGRIGIANSAARRMLGYGDDTPLPELTTLFRSKAARAAIDEVLAGEIVRDRELEMDDLILLLNARPLDDRGAVLVLHDLTAMRRLETVRRDFIANASHELKTPLTSIAGYTETLRSDHREMDETVLRGFLDTILANARRMQHLVDDLLDLSRIESGRWSPTPEVVDVARIAGECWQLLAGKTTAHRAELVLRIAEDAAAIHADPETMRQILGNLLDNAIRYIPVGGSVTVRSERSDGGVLLSVEDNGSGIPAEHLPRIFERFYRVDPSRSRDEGGTGLGLAIVKHLVETQGGRVSAESTLREGTAIRCWFPAL